MFRVPVTCLSDKNVQKPVNTPIYSKYQQTVLPTHSDKRDLEF